MNEELIEALSRLMEARFSGLTKPLRKNLVVSTFAFILVLSAMRSGQGRLSLAALARALPTVGTAHAREKRLHRFLKNSRLDFRAVTGSLAAILLPSAKRFCPVILDQTKSGSAQALLAAVPYAGRALPIACYTFAYPSRNLLSKVKINWNTSFSSIQKPLFPSALLPSGLLIVPMPVRFCSNRVNRNNDPISYAGARRPLLHAREDG